MQSNQLFSRDPQFNIFYFEFDPKKFKMEPRAKEWMLAIARGDYHAISRLLREEPRLARRRVSVVLFVSLSRPASGRFKTLRPAGYKLRVRCFRSRSDMVIVIWS